MAINIKDPEADRLARELAKQKGANITTVVIEALRNELEREKRKDKSDIERRRKRIAEIVEGYSKLPVYDNRSLEEMLYDENGLPK